jgi:hypothetical protein
MVIGWIAMVMFGARLLRSFDLKTRSVGLAALGVLPISAFELAAEAHNDVVMMALVVYWLWLRAEGSWLSPIPLALSILVKYVTAPLLLLAAVDAWRRGRVREAVCAFVLGTVILLAALYFWQNGVLLASLTKYNASWRWLSAPFAIELIVKNLAPFSWVAPAYGCGAD